MRRNAIRKVNRERQARRAREDRVYGSYHRWIGTWPCLLANASCWGTVAGHHVRSVGAGGEDYANEIPLCTFHHGVIEAKGRLTFEARYGLDLEAVARGMARRV